MRARLLVKAVKGGRPEPLKICGCTVETSNSMNSIFLLLASLVSQLVADEPGLPRELLGLTDDARRGLAEASRHNLIEIAPVHLPVNPPGDCNHKGWPITTMVDDTIVVMHRRIPGHITRGAGTTHEKKSYGVVLRSNDGGKTWSQPYDLRDCIKPEEGAAHVTKPSTLRWRVSPSARPSRVQMARNARPSRTRETGNTTVQNMVNGTFCRQR